MALAALTEKLRQAAAAVAAAEANQQQIVQATNEEDDIDWEEATLYEAIESDRRLTMRNIIRWLDQLSICILNSHRSYVSVGDFSTMDVKVGNRASLASAISYSEAFTAWLKLGNDALTCKYDTGDPSLSSQVVKADAERIAVLDFHRRVREYQNSLATKKKDPNATASEAGPRLPKAFECQKMLRFDYRHDNNICVPKEHAFHTLLVTAYREFSRHIWQDLRCLGIVILQIYSLCIFPPAECEKLMRWPVPEPPAAAEDAEEASDPGPGANLFDRRRSTVAGAATAGSVDARRNSHAAAPPIANLTAGRRSSNASPIEGRRASSAGQEPQGHGVKPLKIDTNTSGTKGDANSKPSSPAKTGAAGGKQPPVGGKQLSAGSSIAPSTATTTPAGTELSKPRLPRTAKLPGLLEQSLLPSYPCISRMPAEVKDLLLTVCFTRMEDCLIEKSVKRSGEDCTRLECPLLALLKEARTELHELALKMDADCHFVPQSFWTPADERARLAAIKERQDRLAQQAEQGPITAMARLKRDRYLLWLSMQTEEFREKLEARKRARRKAQRNTIMRRKYIYQASFHRWNMVNFTYWVQEALLDYCTMLLDIRTKALHEKKKSKKNPAVYVTKLMNDLMAVFTKTAIAKFTAYREKRIEEDSVGWEKALTFVRPSTSGGNKADLARSDLESAGLLPKASTQTATQVVLTVTESDHDSLHGADTSAAATTLPDINRAQSRVEARSRQRRAKSAGGKAGEVAQERSLQEILTECFATFAALMPRLLLQKERSPFNWCHVMRQAIAAQEKDEAEAVSERVLVTSEEQLYYKRLAAQAGHFTALLKVVRNKVIELSDLIDLLDRGWVKFVVHLVASAIMNHYHKYAPNRRKGENYAADRLIAFFRGIVVRNIVARVWQRTKLLLAAAVSPTLSSKGSSAKNSPASTYRKHLAPGLAAPSGDSSKDNRSAARDRTASHHAPSGGTNSAKLSPQSPAQSVSGSVKAKRRNTERRKPLCFRSIQTPTARSMVIDLSVSIESDDTIAPGTASEKELARLFQRYDDWRKVKCIAFIETDLAEEPGRDVTSRQALQDSHMFVAGAPLHQQHQNHDHRHHSQHHNSHHGAGGSSTHHHQAHKIEQPIKRRLIIRLFSHTNRKLFGLDGGGSAKEDVAVRKTPVKVSIDVVDGVPLDPVTQQPGLLAEASVGGNRVRSQSQHSTGLEDAWDDRSIESQSVIAGKKPNSSFPLLKEPPKQVTHTVVSYKIQLEDILAFSCYNVQIEFDRSLADDLREGNKSYFRYLSLVDENDELSVDSDDSLQHVRFAEVGKQWAIAVEEAIEVNSQDSASIEAFPELEVMKVELEQYIYTRPGIPRTVKDLTAKVAYSNADLLNLTRSDSHSPSMRGSTGPAAKPVLFSPVYQPDTALPGMAVDPSHDNSLNPASHFIPSHEMRDNVQGCVLLHWRHSIDDNHGNTHYEVQRRLLLISSAPPAKLKPPPGSAIVNRPHSRDFNHHYRDKEAEAARANEPQSTEEAIYVGPWHHVAGLKGSPNEARTSTASKKPTANNKLTLPPMWTFPLHANSCTDKVSLPDELNTNPDAYNCVMGYLCACFPDLVMQAASRLAAAEMVSEEASLASGVSSRSRSSKVTAVAEADVLQERIPSNLRISYEYRVRAINSAGVGKFNSVSATVPLNYMLHDGRKPIKMCVVPVALVCTYLSALKEFRTHHPKYRSLNVGLVTDVLAQRAEALKVDTENFLVEPSGDPFVEQLVAIKDGGTQVQDTARTDVELEPGTAEDPQIGAWLKALQLDCPL